MKIPQGARKILDQLQAAGYEAWAVGGCVRDSLLGRIPHDWDLCTSAMPWQIEEVFRGSLRMLETGIAHGTVTLLTEDGPVEVTTFRMDGVYTDHRRPDQVVLGVCLEEDLARRDFTINAMAMSKNGELVDLYGGQLDLASRSIRCVGCPEERFQEDALRILRALRFAAQLDFEIEEATLAAAEQCSPLLAEVARERVFAELDALLKGPGAGRVLAMSGPILAKAIPAIGPALGFELHSPVHNRDLWQHTAAAVELSQPDREVRWALLLHDLAKPSCFVLDGKGIGHAPDHGPKGGWLAEQILHGLHAPNRLVNPVRQLVRFHDFPAPPKEVSVRRWMARIGPQLLEKLIEVKRADLAAHAPCAEVQRRQRQLEMFAVLYRQVLQQDPCLTLEQMTVGGRDLIRAGICRPGPRIGRILNQLLYQVIEGNVPNEKEALLRLARQLKAQEES